ncbi:MAG: endolytic transglycosylase MltG [Bacteroidales bacterium]|nr:endolytic transglycosylase MltG [Bacteroidales bacterium]
MKSRNRILLLLLPGLILVLFITLVYSLLYGPHIKTGGKKITIYIPDGSTYTQAMDSVKAHISVKHPKTLEWIAERKKYPQLVKPGRYVLESDMSYTALINYLRSGRQNSVNVTFNNIRTLNDLAGRIGMQIDADSTRIITFLTDPDNYSKDGFTAETVIAVFIPNTYQLFWNTTPKGLYNRMLGEYKKFWNDDRLARAKEKNLTPVEVSILASIIDDEVAKPDEKPRIAGVYLNRLKRGIPLQACPTIKFALNDFTITRVLKKHLEIDSPYNTYKHRGFPPGPIGCASVEGIDAVLNAEEHDYLYFAAKADFSGYHNFSRTLAEHNRYAAIYQRELNKRRIFR